MIAVMIQLGSLAAGISVGLIVVYIVPWAARRLVKAVRK